MAGRPCRRPVGYDNRIGILCLHLFYARYPVHIAVNLAKQPLLPLLYLIQSRRGKAGLVVEQAGNVVAVALAERNQRWHIATRIVVGEVPFRRHFRPRTFHNANLGKGQFNCLRHAPQHLIGEQDHRGTVPLGEVERVDDQLVGFTHRAGTEDDNGMVPVCSPAGLHHIALSRAAGPAGAGAGALHVDNDARDLGCGGVADTLLHQREPGPAGGGSRLEPAH